MEKSKFFEEVKAELVHLRDTATQEEIKKLNFSEFDHTVRYACIYGQMTGSCGSARAKQLTPKTYGDVSGKKFEV